MFCRDQFSVKRLSFVLWIVFSEYGYQTNNVGGDLYILPVCGYYIYKNLGSDFLFLDINTIFCNGMIHIYTHFVNGLLMIFTFIL